jgi:DNA-binding winged helix-turn-helix (wHTH) protein/predicted Zn-dependent protease
MERSSPASAGPPASGYVFAGFRLEADGTLYRGETPVYLPPKELAALRLLLTHAGQVVSPLQLRQALWGDMQAAADSVSRCLSSLRARLSPDECIETVYKRGYRLSAEARSYGESAGKMPRLVILPFATGFGAPEYLGFAVAEAAAALLNGAHDAVASVPAQDSVFALARRGLGARPIGEALGADLVLTGTMRISPAHYRLRAEMMRVADGSQLWVEDLLVERDRIAAPETELARRVTLRLHDGSLSIFAVAAPAEQPEPSPQSREAYDLYQRAHHEWQTLERHQMQDGLQRLLRAIELDPALTAARVDLVNLCVTESIFGYMSPAAAADLVRRVSAEASVPVQGGEALLPGLGWIEFHVNRNLPAALWAFSLSAHLPHNPWITRARTMFALSRRRFGEAIETLRAAIRLDPCSPWLQARLGWALYLAGETAASIRQAEQALAMFPEHEGSSIYGASILACNGQAARAEELARKLVRRFPYVDVATAVHAYALACAGRTDEARAILERLDWLSRERYVMNTLSPAVYVVLGDHDAALAGLRTAGEARCPWFFQALADPRLKALHGRPEFAEMEAILPAMEAAAERDAWREQTPPDFR